jgi:hypothetical protein
MKATQITLGIYRPFVQNTLSNTCRGHKSQQINMELHTFSSNLGSCGTGTAPADVKPPWLEDVSDVSSNLTNCPIWVAAKWA